MDEVMTMADVTASTRHTTTTSSPPYLLPSNLPLFSAFLSFALAQFLKIFTTWYKEKRWDSRRLLDSGGMPSSHSATVSALAVAVGFQEGAGSAAFAVAVILACIILRYKEKRWDSRRLLDSGGMPSSHSATVSALAVAVGFQEGAGSAAFAVAVILACIVMYDASGVRLHAGRQAELLNQIVCELPPEHPLSNVRPLRDSLGHTPLQVVAGGLLGCILAFLMRK